MNYTEFNAVAQITAGYFDENYYSACNNLKGSSKFLKRHYRFMGEQIGLDPNPLFHSVWYKKMYLSNSFFKANPFRHYLAVGWKLGYDPHPLFNITAYLKENVDVRDSEIEPTLHYLHFGFKEKRTVSGWFNPSDILDSNTLNFDQSLILRTYFGQNNLGIKPGSKYMPSPLDQINFDNHELSKKARVSSLKFSNANAN